MNRLKNELIKISRRCYNRGYVSSTSGNISVKKQDAGGIYIKASGTCFGDLQLEDIVEVEWDGSYKGKKPSKETGFHMGIYKMREEVNAVVHIHSPYCIALSLKYEKMPLSTVSAEKNFTEVPLIPTCDPGSDDLQQYVLEKFGNKDIIAAVLKGHGVVTVGKNLKEAFYKADLLEHNAKITFIKNSLP